ncbi:putative retrotransposon hot spot protein (RHS) [Trypanosoma cruzi]|uniref:Putative retrotransposon hot spot protein (RHS) n=1 Tax=Trypanosoma cruzi TaxID=5693 RepID=A0A2V2VNT3_TRYCR|nr:putative retrotransposon hot spot protein (RHS) [Trypanosoma cruzi]
MLAAGRPLMKDYNVTMEMFVQESDDYVQDQRLLRIIFNLTEYQVYKLHHEGVFSLEQWRDYEGKDTVTPLARGKLNAALTQILKVERREAEMKFAISTTIEDVLFKGRVRVNKMRLNDFLRGNWTAGALWTPIGMSCRRSFSRTPRSISVIREY